MSTIVMTACWPLKMPPTFKAVLISLADQASDSGQCWPSIASIAKRTCLSERTVQAAVRWLAERGAVQLRLRTGKSTVYTVTPGAYQPPQQVHPRRRRTPAADAPQPPQDVHPTPAGRAPRTIKEPSVEPSIELPLAHARGAAGDAGLPAAKLLRVPKIPDCPHERLIALYHERLPSLPRVREWNEVRQRLLRARWREKAKPNGSAQGYATVDAGLEWWGRFFDWVAESRFLTGRANGRGDKPPFVADLEWLLRPTNFARVIEGRYHDAAA
jgi:hypothetical protein